MVYNVTFIYRNAVYATDTKGQADKTAEIILAKQRNGATATIKLDFEERTMRFVDSK